MLEDNASTPPSPLQELPSKQDASAEQTPAPAPARDTDKLRVEYSLYAKALPPRQVKLSIPGWAGAADKMKDGSQPQPWHCLPFVEASTYGLELVYQYDAECQVINDNGTVRFEWDFARETGAELTGGEFMFFEPIDRPAFYLFNTRMDIEPPPGHVIRTEPHPRYFTDDSGTVPLAMIGHLQNEWFPRKLFVVFRVPPPGRRHAFRKGEPFAQILFIPQRVGYDLAPMSAEKESHRRELEKVMIEAQQQIATNLWRNPQGSAFSNYYKILARAFSEGGAPAVQAEVDKAIGELRSSLEQKTLAQCLREGGEHLNRQEFDQAGKLYRQALARDPANAEAMSFAGVCAVCGGATAPGLRMMTQAIALQPRSALLHFNLGKMLALLKRYAEAEAPLRQALRLNPRDVYALDFLAQSLAATGRLPEAAQAARAALQLNPAIAAHHLTLGHILAQLGQTPEARAAFERALKLSPNLEEAKRALQQLPS